MKLLHEGQKEDLQYIVQSTYSKGHSVPSFSSLDTSRKPTHVCALSATQWNYDVMWG